MIENNLFWKRFEKTGKVEDYLEYACTTEESMIDVCVDGVFEGEVMLHDTRDCYRAGTFIAKYR